MRAVQAGDRAAASALYQRHLPGVWRYVRLRLANDQQTAEDVTSETFLAAFRSVGAFDQQSGTVYGWLLGVARNKLRDHFRRAARIQRDSTAPGDVTVNLMVEATDRAGGPDQALSTTETGAAVLAVLDTMIDDERVALELKYVDGRSVGDIAVRLGRTPKATEALLYRARRIFRTRYARNESQ